METSEEISRLEERIVVLRARSGDTQAFQDLVDLYERRLLYYILRFVDDAHDALDVLQEVWLSAFRLLPRLETPEAFRVWLYKITHGKVVEFLRRQRRVSNAIDEVANRSDESAPWDEPVLELENVELVHRALDRVSVEHREVLTLHFLEEMPLEEIAQVLSCPLGTVKSRIHYAKRSIRSIIERLIHDEP